MVLLVDSKLQEFIGKMIYEFQGNKVICIEDLARIYGVDVRILRKQVKKYPERFGPGFLFKLTTDDYYEMTNPEFPEVDLLQPTPIYCFSGPGVLSVSHLLESPQAIELSKHIVEVTTMMLDITKFPMLEITPNSLSDIQDAIDGLSPRAKLILAISDLLNEGKLFPIPGFREN